MIDFRDPPEELVAGGVAQILVAVLAFGAVELRPALATAEFVVSAWLIGAVASTIAYFAAGGRLANQRPTATDSETLVSDERGQMTGTPRPLLDLLLSAFIVLVGGKITSEAGFDPLFGYIFAGAMVLTLWIGFAVPLRGGYGE